MAQSAGAFTAAMAVLDAGDEVICFDPMYVTYAGVIMAPGAVMRFVPLRPENGFQPDPAEVRRAVGPRAERGPRRMPAAISSFIQCGMTAPRGAWRRPALNINAQCFGMTAAQRQRTPAF